MSIFRGRWLRRKAGTVSKYIEIICITRADVFEEMSRKVKENFEFVSVIVKGPSTFLLRMRRKLRREPGPYSLVI
jgi:hypothetical protein